jgi:hypothetical protein
MADEVATYIRRATLGAMQKGDAAFNAAEDQASAEGGAKFAGVAGGGEILRAQFAVGNQIDRRFRFWLQRFGDGRFAATGARFRR